MPWQFKGGIQTHAWQLAHELHDLNHKVTMLISGSFKNPAKRYIKEGIEIVEIPYFPGRRLKFFNIAAEEISFNIAVKDWVKKNHEAYDIIHTQGRSGYLLYMLPQVYHKHINTVHGLIDIESQLFPKWNLNKQLHAKLASFFEKRLFKATKNLIAVSHTLKNDITKLRDKDTQSSVIPNGIPVKDEPLMIGRKAPKYLFIGRLHPIKGILELVETMAQGSKELKLDIVGGGSLQPQIENAIETLGLIDRVKLLGEKNHAEIEEMMPKYKALILPSHYETQGIVILEANVKGVPVIASDIPAIRESVEHMNNGMLCNPKKSEEFVRAMEFMAKEDLQAQCMGIRGRKMVKAKYDWKLLAKDIERMYLKLAS